jgi:hypothetical protein
MKNKALHYLAVEGESMKECLSELAPLRREHVTLKRTFNQKTYDKDLKPTGAIKFWRVIGPASHKNYQSDLSLDGLREWGIVK